MCHPGMAHGAMSRQVSADSDEKQKTRFRGATMNRLQKLCILICVFSPFVIFGSYASGAPIDDLILYWGVFVTSFVGIFLFREKLLP